MPIYQVEFDLVATAYIKADTEEQALQIAIKHSNDSIEVYGTDISSVPFADEDLPDFSFSPMMTVVNFDSDNIEETY